MFNPDFVSGYLGVGQAWGDFDNDGWLDLFFTGNIADNVLFRNEGGVFSRSALTADVAMPGELTGGAVFADYDNDGWSDLYVIAQGSNRLFRNREGTGFEDVTAAGRRGRRRQGFGSRLGRLRRRRPARPVRHQLVLLPRVRGDEPRTGRRPPVPQPGRRHPSRMSRTCSCMPSGWEPALP